MYTENNLAILRDIYVSKCSSWPHTKVQKCNLLRENKVLMRRNASLCMFNSIFLKNFLVLYTPITILPLKDLKNYLQIDSFFCQGIVVGQTSDYKIHFWYNERLANKIKNQWFALCHWQILFTRFFGFSICLIVNTRHIFSMYLRRCISQGNLFTVLCSMVLKSNQTIDPEIWFSQLVMCSLNPWKPPQIYR